jgi:hypothetical protein
MYLITLDYRETAGFHGIQLKWNGAVIPSSNLYMQQEVIGSRCCVSNAYPAPVCGTTATLSGVGLSLQTAGIISTFRLTIRDAFSNIRTLSSIGTDLNLAFQQFTSPIAPAALVAPVFKANLTNLNYGVFSASYMVTSAGALFPRKYIALAYVVLHGCIMLRCRSLPVACAVADSGWSLSYILLILDRLYPGCNVITLHRLPFVSFDNA